MLHGRSASFVARVSALLLAAVFTSGFLSGWSSSAPELWEGWEVHDPANTRAIDHGAWDNFLKRYVRRDNNGLNRLAYSKVSPSDRKELKSYIARLSAMQITASARNIQLAYWINLYNALTVDVVLDHYPVESIRDIDISGAFADGPWGKELVTIEGVGVSLDNIEHEILRPIWKDPRVHYGVNCASVGCPNLLRDAFTGENVNKLLDKAARDYVNSPRGLRIAGGEITVSRIYKWFAYDFGNSEKGVISHLAQYATPDRATQLRQIGRISATQYDWSLNE